MNCIDNNKFKFVSNQNFLFDSNIWIFLFAPLANVHKEKQNKYSRLIRNIQSNRGTIYITSLIISEYVNRVLRLEFALWKANCNIRNPEFKKDYRPTSAYDEALKNVKSQVQDILKLTVKYPDNFQNCPVDSLLNQMNKDCDYNDLYIVHSCDVTNSILVSDDKDMNKITSNVFLMRL